MASVAKATAVSKPKQFVVPTMSLSMVFGTPTSGMPRLVELVGDGQRAVAADDDQRVEPHLVEHLDARGRSSRVVPSDVVDRIGERVAAVDGAEDGAAEAQDAA